MLPMPALVGRPRTMLQHPFQLLPGGWDHDTHAGDCCPRVEDDCWRVCCGECAGTGVFPVPWINTVMEGVARRLMGLGDASCVACKATGRQAVALASPVRAVGETLGPAGG